MHCTLWFCQVRTQTLANTPWQLFFSELVPKIHFFFRYCIAPTLTFTDQIYFFFFQCSPKCTLQFFCWKCQLFPKALSPIITCLLKAHIHISRLLSASITSLYHFAIFVVYNIIITGSISEDRMNVCTAALANLASLHCDSWSCLRIVSLSLCQTTRNKWSMKRAWTFHF